MMEAKDYTIDKGKELKFESSSGRESVVVARVLDGACECFGTVLEKDRVYSFPAGIKAALSAPTQACKVQLMNHETGKTTVNPWSGSDYQKLLQELNDKRDEAKRNNTSGPRILVCGPSDTGKSTLCKIIINSAVRAGHAITFTDADLGQNAITVPGSIASVFVEDKQVDVEESFTLLPPVAFFFGDVQLQARELGKYHHLCAQSAACTRANAENRRQFLHGGIVLNSMGWARDTGYSALKLLVETFEVNCILCIDDKILYDRLKEEDWPNANIQFLSKKTVASRNQPYRRQQRGERVAEYFRGIKTPLHPVRVVLPLSEVQAYQIGFEGGGPSIVPVLPEFLRLTQVTLEPSHALLLAAVSHASRPEEVPHANVAGFVVILKVDTQASEVTLLMPSGNKPPTRYLILSKIAVTYEDIMS